MKNINEELKTKFGSKIYSKFNTELRRKLKANLYSALELELQRELLLVFRLELYREINSMIDG